MENKEIKNTTERIAFQDSFAPLSSGVAESFLSSNRKNLLNYSEISLSMRPHPKYE